MKKILCVLTVFILVFLCACSAGEPASAGDAAVTTDITDADIALAYEGNQYAINDKAAALITALGDNYEFDQSDSCAYEGFDKYYVYTLENGEVILFTIPLLNGEDTICQIETSSPSFATTKGITIGSTLNDVIAAYGDNFVEDSSNYYFFAGEQSFTDTPHIYFTIENDAVTYMSIYSAKNHG